MIRERHVGHKQIYCGTFWSTNLTLSIVHVGLTKVGSNAKSDRYGYFGKFLRLKMIPKMFPQWKVL